MNGDVLGSKYFDLPGKIDQMVIRSVFGDSRSRQWNIVPPGLVGMPIAFLYQAPSALSSADLKKIPPIPRIRPGVEASKAISQLQFQKYTTFTCKLYRPNATAAHNPP